MKKRYYIASFIFPMLLFTLVAYLMDKYPFSEKMLTSGDFMGQYLPLYAALKSAILSLDWQSFFWSFQKGLGGTMPSVFGFNSLSPLTMIYTFFPVKDYAAVTFLVTSLRYGLASLSMFYYLDKTKKATYAQTPLLMFIFALAYSFSGYMVKNHINPNFLDNLIYFPLLLIGFEKIMAGRWSFKYAFILGLMWLTNFYTAFMATLFIVLYGLLKVSLLKQPLNEKLKTYMRLGILSFTGVFLVAFWLMPVIVSLLESKASAKEIFTIDFSMLYNPIHLASKIFVGSFHSTDHNALPSIYFLLIGWFGFVHFFLSREISKPTKIMHALFILIILITFNIHFFDQIWHMGQRPIGFYFRNAWVFSFYLLTLSFQGLNQKWHFERKQLLVQMILMVTMFGIVIFNDYRHLIPLYKYMTVIIFMLIVIIFTLYQGKRTQLVMGALAFLSIGELTINTLVGFDHFYWYDSISYIDNYSDLAQTPVFSKLDEENPQEFYRADFYKTVILSNLPFYTTNYGLSHFSSSLEFSQIKLYEKLGLPSSTSILTYQLNPLTDTLFHLKYYGTDKLMNAYLPQIQARFEPIMPFYQTKMLLENKNYLDFGLLVSEQFIEPLLEDDNPFNVHNDLFKKFFNIDQNLYQEVEFTAIEANNLEKVDPKWQRIDANLATRLTFIFDQVQENKIYFIKMPFSEYDLRVGQYKLLLNGQSYYFLDRYRSDQIWPVAQGDDGKIQLEILSESSEKYDFSNLQLYAFDLSQFEALIKEKQATDVSLVYQKPTTFTGEIDISDAENNYLFLSIPYNSGWTATIDGQQVPIIQVWETLMAVQIPLGKHHFELSYRPPGLLLGSLISLVTLAAILILKIKMRK